MVAQNFFFRNVDKLRKKHTYATYEKYLIFCCLFPHQAGPILLENMYSIGNKLKFR